MQRRTALARAKLQTTNKTPNATTTCNAQILLVCISPNFTYDPGQRDPNNDQRLDYGQIPNRFEIIDI